MADTKPPVKRPPLVVKMPADVILRKHIPELARGVAEGMTPKMARAIHQEVMADVEKRLARHLKEIEALVRSIAPPQIHVAPSVAQLTPNIVLPEHGQPTVHFNPVVNVPEQQPAKIEFNPQIMLPDQVAPVVNFSPTVRVPEQAAPVINFSPNVQMPEQIPPTVNFAPVVNVPQQEAPHVTVQAAKVQPVFNVPEQAPPTVNVQASEVNPIFNMDIPKRTTTVKKIEYAVGTNRPEKIVEETTND
jgi:hypothetical protein